MIGSEEKILKIKKIAFDLFLEIGYEATTIRMICKEAEIESPTLYYFFKSKKGLFLDVRNTLEQEYRQLIAELELEKEKNPVVALKRNFKFCIDYAKKNPDKTRYYIRYQLFKPTELREEIDKHIKASYEDKKVFYGNLLRLCIDSDFIDCSIDVAFRKYSNFIDNSAYNIIFSHWEPTEEEVDSEWEIFFKTNLNKATHL